MKLIGRIRSEHLDEVKKNMAGLPGSLVFDLEEVTLIDLDTVRFLGMCEAQGAQLTHCAPYIREWITRERNTNNGD